MPEINEWTFAADVCKTIQGILAESSGLPFSGAKVEEAASVGRERRDLTLYDNHNRPVLTGEIKLPDRPDGQSTYADPLVDDASQKANAKGVEHFLTWNVKGLFRVALVPFQLNEPMHYTSVFESIKDGRW